MKLTTNSYPRSVFFLGLHLPRSLAAAFLRLFLDGAGGFDTADCLPGPVRHRQTALLFNVSVGRRAGTGPVVERPLRRGDICTTTVTTFGALSRILRSGVGVWFVAGLPSLAAGALMR